MRLIMLGFASIGYFRGQAGLRELSFESDVSTIDSVKQNLSGKECYHYLPLPRLAVCWPAVCDCSISWSYSFTFKLTFSIQFLKVVQQEQHNFL